MKKTGIVRKMDSLGRIVVPKEIRMVLGMDVGDPVEILVDEDAVVLKRYFPDRDLLAKVGFLEESLNKNYGDMASGTVNDVRNHIEAIKELLQEGGVVRK